MNFTLGKKQSLSSQKTIAQLFESGNKINCYPFTAIFLETTFDDEQPVKWVFSAPKKKFKHAYKRNRIKRISREAIRLNKQRLELYLNQKQIQIAVFLIYTAEEELNHITLQKKATKLLDQIIQHFDEKVS